MAARCTTCVGRCHATRLLRGCSPGFSRLAIVRQGGGWRVEGEGNSCDAASLGITDTAGAWSSHHHVQQPTQPPLRLLDYIPDSPLIVANTHSRSSHGFISVAVQPTGLHRRGPNRGRATAALQRRPRAVSQVCPTTRRPGAPPHAFGRKHPVNVVY